jgi:hypothetical protein
MSDLTDRLREEYCNCLPAYKDRGMVDPQCESCQTLPERIEAADEIDRLTAECERLKTSWSTMARVGSETADLNDKLAAERDALRADAARYRWLRNEDADLYYIIIGGKHLDGERADAAIDAALKGEA